MVETNSINESNRLKTKPEMLIIINKLEYGLFRLSSWNFSFLLLNTSRPEKRIKKPTNTTKNWVGWTILK